MICIKYEWIFTRFIKLHLIYADSARFDSKLIAYRQVSVAA